LLAREMPVIMNRLRETRNAIANVGTDYIPDGANNGTIPFAFIEDANDRRTLIRYIDDYSYLLNQLDTAFAFNDRSQIAEVQGALERKNQQMKRLVGIWGPKIDSVGGGLGATGQFIRTANAGIPGYNQETHNNVSLSQCQSLCIERSWCKSIDFERAANRCYVQPIGQNETNLRTNYPGNPYDHYTLSGR